MKKFAQVKRKRLNINYIYVIEWLISTAWQFVWTYFMIKDGGIVYILSIYIFCVVGF